LSSLPPLLPLRLPPSPRTLEVNSRLVPRRPSPLPQWLPLRKLLRPRKLLCLPQSTLPPTTLPPTTLLPRVFLATRMVQLSVLAALSSVSATGAAPILWILLRALPAPMESFLALLRSAPFASRVHTCAATTAPTCKCINPRGLPLVFVASAGSTCTYRIRLPDSIVSGFVCAFLHSGILCIVLFFLYLYLLHFFLIFSFVSKARIYRAGHALFCIDYLKERSKAFAITSHILYQNELHIPQMFVGVFALHVKTVILTLFREHYSQVSQQDSLQIPIYCEGHVPEKLLYITRSLRKTV